MGCECFGDFLHRLILLLKTELQFIPNKPIVSEISSLRYVFLPFLQRHCHFIPDLLANRMTI